jgi:hypothetical protein
MSSFVIISLMLFSYFGGGSDVNRSANAAIENEVMQVIDKQRELALHKDVPGMRQVLADDYLSTNAYGQVRTKQETVDVYEHGEIVYTALAVSEMRILVLSPTSAVANFKVTTVEHNKGIDESGYFRVTRVFAKRQGRWQVVVNHSTSLAV